MLNEATIAKFLGRRLASYDWLKQATAAELASSLAKLTPKPDFSIKLWLHQQACFLLALELKRFMFFVDLGGGKTLLTLLLIKYLKQCGKKPRAIIFVPYITSVETWVEQVAEHTPELKCVALLGTTAENLSHLTDDGDLFVICYQSCVAMLADARPVAAGKKTKWQLESWRVRKQFAGFNMLILDEAHRAKSASSLTYRMCRAISQQAEYVFGLTGTPFGRDLADLWPQFYLIDFGKTLGHTASFYRSVFFNESQNYWGGRDYTFKQKLLPTLQRTIKNCSISYSVDEFYDMPPKEYIKRHLPAPQDSKGYIDKAIAELRSGIKGKHYQAVQSSYLQLRQLSSGFMTLRGEDNDKLQIQFAQNPKLDALVELLEAVPHGCKIVCFHHFIYTNKMISDKLKELKIKHARIWGGQRDPIGELRRFKNDPDCTVLVINWKSGSSSLNLQNASYLIVYEQPESPIDRKQGEARLWRPGQARRVFIYDLVMKNTVDERLRRANEAGKNLLEELLNGHTDLDG